ncbi:PIN domain-containing protein [Patescibacteria group bacterium]|nr:PIN domain-containing protein [Patescibacteria group bacterium]
MPKKYKLFIDSSALIAGLNSPTGGAGIILSGYLSGDFFVYISEQVIEEVQKNIQLKFPLLKERFLNFLLSHPIIIKQPSLKEIRSAYKLILTEDAPILAAAIGVRPDFLITWDKKHFLKKEVISNTSFVICTPKEFIQKYWAHN